MSSQRRIEANRRNAQKSAGPTSVTGKAASSKNAIKTGVHGRFEVLRTEKLEDLRDLAATYYRLYQPTSPEECLLIDQAIQADWLLLRCHNDDTQLQRRFDAAIRNYHETCRALERFYAPVRNARLLN